MALVTKCVVKARQRQCYISLVADAAALTVKLGTRWRASVFRGEWASLTCRKAFKDKATLQLHSKSFGLKQLCNEKLKYKILKFKVVCVVS